MPMLDAVFVGRIYLPEIGGGPIMPPGGQPPGIWGGAPLPWPGHPISPGGPPPGYWGGVAPPLPTHPISPGGPPPGYWGGVAPPLPTHPISPGGPGGPPSGSLPPGYWGGAPLPVPTPPIYLPIGEEGRQKKLEAKTAWSEQTGWVIVFVPTEEATVPTPSDQPTPS